jgi:hypothetical protein
MASNEQTTEVPIVASVLAAVIFDDRKVMRLRDPL